MVAPITFDAADSKVSTIAFAVDADQDCLSFDSTDANADRVPDSVALMVPAGFISQVQFVSGAIRFVLFGFGVAMPDGVIAEITFTVSDAQDCHGATAEVGFSSSGPAFGDNLDRPVSGWSRDGSIKIADN